MELDFLEIFGTLVGLVYLWLEYRASIYLWIAGVVMPAIYIFVYYKAGLYADFGINIYYLIAAVYGCFFWMWGHRKRSAGRQTSQPPVAPKTSLSCTLRGNVTFHWQLYLLSPLSALHGYLSNIPTVTFRGWIALPLP